MEEYRVRIADQLLSESLEALGAVLVQGTKWCGKTTTSVHHAGSVLYMDDPMQKEQNLSLAQTNIKRLLEGDTPRVIEAVSPHRKTLHHTFSAAPAATYCLLPIAYSQYVSATIPNARTSSAMVSNFSLSNL